MSKKLREMQAKKAELVKSARALTDSAATEGRDLNDEEVTAFDGLKGRIDALNAAIEREQTLIAEEAQLGIESALPSVSVTENMTADPKWGFKNFGEYAYAVHQAGLPGNPVDNRLSMLRNAAVPGVYGNESAGADGGFLIPPQFAKDIFMLSLDDEAFLPLTDNIEISGNSLVLPKDETTPWGTDGITVAWQGEGTPANASKPKFGTASLRLKKLMALVPITDELLSDTDALTSYTPKKVASRMQWKINESILFGNGSGIPQGALSGKALVTIAKDSGQATNTLTPTNLANMIAALPPGSFKKAVWIVNNSVLPSLFTLTLGNYPIYLPLGGGVAAFKGSPYGTLLGRPVYVSQHASAFSSQGDVLLVDLTYYQTITKVGGMETATSMHLYFDADATAFRTIFRMDGQPKIAAPILPAKGSAALSPFVQLGAR